MTATMAEDRWSNSKPALCFRVRAPRTAGAPRHTVVLSHALGCDQAMWDELAEVLSADCRVITYDHRGHGGSDAPDGLYQIADLADDAARLLHEINSGPVVWVGLSMGGMVGQELALRHPALVAGLVIANSTSRYPEAARAAWQQRIHTVRAEGIESIANAVMERYFHQEFRARQPATIERFRARLVATDKNGYIGCCHAVGTVDTTDRLHQITAPTLVIAGELDQGTPVSMAETLVAGIAGSRLAVLQDASHLSATEQPTSFADAVVQFMRELD